MGPGDVLVELLHLTQQAEETIIARCSPIVRVYNDLNGKQFGCGGRAINIAQDVNHFAARLPRLGPDVTMIPVRREGQEGGEHK